MGKTSLPVPISKARAIWIAAQKLDVEEPFGAGPEAVRRTVEHLGYVQIDTINVIERSHHHILYSRIPRYRREDLEEAQSNEKSVFEYWTHALAYVPSPDYRYFIPAMKEYRKDPGRYLQVDPKDYKALIKRIRDEGALSIRDIEDDVLEEKMHLWASRKPSKRALQFGFYTGDLVIGKRTGMLKTYELTDRHFGWAERPKPASDTDYAKYLLARALRSQGVVSLDSICYGDVKWKANVMPLINGALRRKDLVPVQVDPLAKVPHWVSPELLDAPPQSPNPATVHILSPFDPLIIQRKRLQMLFNYEHRFEAYVPADKRVLGYFALPVLAGDEIVAAIDLKMDRKNGRLQQQKWTWFVDDRREGLKPAIERALERFETFQAGAPVAGFQSESSSG